MSERKWKEWTFYGKGYANKDTQEVDDRVTMVNMELKDLIKTLTKQVNELQLRVEKLEVEVIDLKKYS